MTSSTLTDERLRNHLDTNQLAKERLCKAILPILGDYRFVRSRYPRGGPDAGRDMECIYAGEILTWCAVGFKNGANDSSKQIKEIRKKFHADLDGAIGRDPKLKGFVFMTNLHLTDTEKKPLKNYATKKGFAHVEIFAREDLRGALDSVSGFPFRLQHLGIEMTREDQQAFVDQYNRQLVEIITHERQTVRAQMERVEFLHWASMPISEVELALIFNEPQSPKGLGPFRVSAQIREIKDGRLGSIIMLGRNGTRAYPQREHEAYGCMTLLLSDNGEIPNKEESFQIVKDEPIRELSFSILRFDNTPTVTLKDLHRRQFSLHVTQNIAKQLAGIALVVDSYLVLEAYRDDLKPSQDMLLDPHWDSELSDAEKSLWREVGFSGTLEMFDWQLSTPKPLF